MTQRDDSNRYSVNWGGVRGGLWCYIPPSEHASPPSEGDKKYLGNFSIYSTSQNMIATVKATGSITTNFSLKAQGNYLSKLLFDRLHIF